MVRFKVPGLFTWVNDQPTLWQNMVISAGVFGFGSFLDMPPAMREISTISATTMALVCKATRTEAREPLEWKAYTRAVVLEAQKEKFFRDNRPDKVVDLLMAGGVDESLVAPLNLLDLPYHDFDRIPHMFFLAATGSGKTTTIGAILDKIPGDIIICDPHATNAQWEGYEVVGQYGQRYEIERLVNCLFDEMERRLLKRKNLEEDYEPLTVIIDETPSAKDEVDEDTWRKKIGKILRESRKVRIRIIFLSQGETIDALGFKGMSEIKTNLTYFRGGRFAIEFAKANRMQELGAWLSQQAYPWMFGSLGLRIPDLSGFSPTPRTTVSEATQCILAKVRKQPNKVADKPKINPHVVIEVHEEQTRPTVSLGDIEAKILEFCNRKGRITVRDVQQNRTITKMAGDDLKIDSTLISRIFKALGDTGVVKYIHDDRTSYVAIKSATRNDVA